MRLSPLALAALLLLALCLGVMIWHTRAELARSRADLATQLDALQAERDALQAANLALAERRAENERKEAENERCFSEIQDQDFASDAEYFDALDRLLWQVFAGEPTSAAGAAAGGLPGPGAR